MSDKGTTDPRIKAIQDRASVLGWVFHLSEEDVAALLAAADAVDPLRQPNPFLDNLTRFSTGGGYDI